MHLLYWAPGLTKRERTTINATARKRDCNRKVCRAGVLEGSATPTTLTVKPYLIYHGDGTVSDKQTEELAGWAGGTSLLSKFGSVVEEIGATHKSLTFALGVLVGAEEAAERAEHALELVEKAEPIVGVLEVGQIGAELFERQGSSRRFWTSSVSVRSALETTRSNGSSGRFRARPSAASWRTSAPSLAVASARAGCCGSTRGRWRSSRRTTIRRSARSRSTSTCTRCRTASRAPTAVPATATSPPASSQSCPSSSAPTTAQPSTRSGRTRFTIPYDPNGWTETQHDLKGLR